MLAPEAGAVREIVGGRSSTGCVGSQCHRAASCPCASCPGPAKERCSGCGYCAKGYCATLGKLRRANCPAVYPCRRACDSAASLFCYCERVCSGLFWKEAPCCGARGAHAIPQIKVALVRRIAESSP